MAQDKQPIGSIAWTDLTVPDATKIRDFYTQVVGLQSEGVSMGDYDDYSMKSPTDGQAKVGVCHARGVNAKIPPYWLVYMVVESVKQSIDRCVELGGKVIDGPRDIGSGQFCVIQDPAGAYVGLIDQTG